MCSHWEHLYPSAAGLDKTLPGFSSCFQISPQRFVRIPDVCFGVLLFLCAPDVPVIPSWLFLPFVFGVCEHILSSFYCNAARGVLFVYLLLFGFPIYLLSPIIAGVGVIKKDYKNINCCPCHLCRIRQGN